MNRVPTKSIYITLHKMVFTVVSQIIVFCQNKSHRVQYLGFVHLNQEVAITFKLLHYFIRKFEVAQYDIYCKHEI